MIEATDAERTQAAQLVTAAGTVIKIQYDKILQCLNTALEADPVAMQAILQHYVPINPDLQARTYAICSEIISTGHRAAALSPLGLLNGVLLAAGLPRVAAAVDMPSGMIVGFTEYKPLLVPGPEMPDE